ncbi:hypothetical protein [Streptomyces sp. AC154]|uniref:hypothetical protein n=1 Tax=Streptomyces sp. AC154 TaxID=3143184 RepID=UPI003F81714D
MSAGAEGAEMSAECRVAQRPGYTELHSACRRTEDVPLPHGGGILLVRRCACAHHSYDGGRDGGR